MTGDIPVLFARGKGLAEAWENAVLEVYREGCDIKTEYDKATDPPSKDCSMTIVVENPLEEPMIHRDMPAGLEDLQEYVMEVLDGIKDHLVRDPDDPDDTRWEYTYHQRLCNYTLPNSDQMFDQIEIMAQKLAEVPYSRRAQAITWKVWEDNDCYDPACLQSIWCRVLINDEDEWVLNTNVRFRSNDAYKAAFMNMYAFIRLQQKIAARISELSGRPVHLGRYVHQADSFHIYGSNLEEFEQRFLAMQDERSFEERTYRYADIGFMMEEAVPGIKEKVARM